MMRYIFSKALQLARKGQETASSAMASDVSGDSEESRTIFFTGHVEEPIVKETMARMIELAEKDPMKPIYLVVNTYGGSVHEAFALYDTMKLIPAPIYTIGLGKIMSAGCLILSAGEQGHRKMGKNATLMYHAAWDVTHGNVWQIEADLIEFKRIQTSYDELVAVETGRTLADVEALYAKDRVDKYLTPEQALAFGFVDALI